MLSTMPDFPLTLAQLFRHGRTVHGTTSEVVTATEHGARRTSFAAVASRVERLAAALSALGIQPGDRVGSMMWNSQEHLEAYFAIPCMGAILHTLNHRLFADQLVTIINHAADRAILVSDSMVMTLAAILPRLTTVQHVIVVGDGEATALGDVLRYDTLLADAPAGYDWPVLDERSGAVMCYTSGTTGVPKGVVYSHRSLYLHAVTSSGSAVLDVHLHDRALVIVPMFHVNAWGYPYSCWTMGADLILPDRFNDVASLCRLLTEERPSFAAGAVTLWTGILQRGLADPALTFPTLTRIISGGSATPRSLMEHLEQRFGAKVVQGWGMTETSSCSALSYAPKDPAGLPDIAWRARSGRITPGIEMRVVGSDGTVLPRDGQSQGEFEVRGPWVTASYFRNDDRSGFHDGWLRTGDLGTLDALGFMTIHDRAKDAVKSGGEWISSIALEAAISAHPHVSEVAVIATPDPRWQERPMAIVVARPGQELDPATLQAFLGNSVARWWIPDHWAVMPSLPKLGTGKIDKKSLRAMREAGELSVTIMHRTAVPAGQER